MVRFSNCEWRHVWLGASCTTFSRFVGWIRVRVWPKLRRYEFDYQVSGVRFRV